MFQIESNKYETNSTETIFGAEISNQIFSSAIEINIHVYIWIRKSSTRRSLLVSYNVDFLYR